MSAMNHAAMNPHASGKSCPKCHGAGEVRVKLAGRRQIVPCPLCRRKSKYLTK